MATKATVYKAELQVADMDRGHYGSHVLTLARHPSETEERMMLRLLAFALHADEALSFGRGISTDDEPDLWQKDLTGLIELWTDLGQPDERRIRRACGRARRVVIYNYGGNAADVWWRQHGAALAELKNLTVWRVPQAAGEALGGLAGRQMQLNCTIQDGQAWLSDGEHSIEVALELRQGER